MQATQIQLFANTVCVVILPAQNVSLSKLF